MTILLRSNLAVMILSVPTILAAFNGAVTAADKSVPQSNQTDPQEPDPQQFLLKYKFRPSQFVHYAVEHTSTFTSQSGAVKDVAQSTTSTRKHYRVVAVDELGNATLELMIDRVRMTNKFNKGKLVEFDSQGDKDKQPREFQHVLKSIGKPTARFRFAANGKLLKIIASMEQSPDPCGPGDSQEEQSASDASRNFLVVFPEKPIPVGTEWSDKFQACVNLANRFQKRVTLQRKYRLESVKNGEATIRLRTSILTDVNEPLIQAQLIQREPKGTILFDIQRGQIVSRASSVDKVVIGAAGPKSSMRAVSQRQEKLITPQTTAKSERPTSTLPTAQ